jgi:transcriptional regulator with XRE-family HTH domain
MEPAGQKLKRVRERLNLKYRDVEEASQRIAERHQNDEFIIALSRLSDIENKGTVPSLYRLYSLCAIYRLDISNVLDWYGVNPAALPGDAASIDIGRTHTIGFLPDGHGEIQIPLSLDPGIDVTKTTFLSRMIQRWGRLPLMLLNGIDLKNHRYAFIGTEDWSMYPLLQPGSLVVVDETKRKILSGGWANEFERPIYFLEHRGGYLCGWCTLSDNRLMVQPHPSSSCTPQLFTFPEEIDVIGQVTGVAMRLDQAKRRRIQT